jgi:hypothetical protein
VGSISLDDDGGTSDRLTDCSRGVDGNGGAMVRTSIDDAAGVDSERVAIAEKQLTSVKEIELNLVLRLYYRDEHRFLLDDYPLLDLQ